MRQKDADSTVDPFAQTYRLKLFFITFFAFLT